MRKGRTVRRTTRAKRAKTARVKKTKGRKSSKKTKGKTKGRKSKGRRGMNKYMIEKEKARKAGADSFVYNGTKYKKATTKTGMVIYKKGGQGGGGSVAALAQATAAYNDWKGKDKGKGK